MTVPRQGDRRVEVRAEGERRAMHYPIVNVLAAVEAWDEATRSVHPPGSIHAAEAVLHAAWANYKRAEAAHERSQSLLEVEG
jgi:hypothetical protein